MSKTLYADFSDEAYEALMRGDAIDNNGLRSKKGNYYPDQPSFRTIPTVEERIQQYKVNITINVADYLLFEIAGPVIKRFTAEKVYPVLAKKWDAWWEQLVEKKYIGELDEAASPLVKRPNQHGEVNCGGNVINLEDYRKRA